MCSKYLLNGEVTCGEQCKEFSKDPGGRQRSPDWWLNPIKAIIWDKTTLICITVTGNIYLFTDCFDSFKQLFTDKGQGTETIFSATINHPSIKHNRVVFANFQITKS